MADLPPPGFVFHPATAEGQGGIAVVEVYGEDGRRAVEALFRPRSGKGAPLPGQVRLGRLLDPDGTPLDEVLVSGLTAEASWCRLPGWAISSHGGAWVQRRLRSALAAAGGREEGRRGVLELARSRGAVDLLEAEALALLPGCRTARAARFLLRMAAGELTARARAVRADLEAGRLPSARARLRELIEGAPAARRLLEPRRVLIAGRPNAGKSSLFNRLAGRERAAVTPTPGATRDLLEELVEIEGYPVAFLDSAGLRPDREAADPVEREGMRRAREAASDAVLFLLSHPGPPEPDERGFLERLPPGRLLLCRSKADLFPVLLPGPPAPGEGDGVPRFSALTGEGLGLLRERIRAAWLGPPESEELPASPFTAALERAAARAAAAPSIDAAREALLEWP